MIMKKFTFDKREGWGRLASTMAAAVSLMLLTGCSTRNGPPAEVHYAQASSPYHVVRKGESLSLIAKKYNLNKNDLVRMNGLQPPYRIVVGQRILIGAPAMGASGGLDDSEAPALEPGEKMDSKKDSRVVQLQPLPGIPASTAPVGVAPPVPATPALAALPAPQPVSTVEEDYQDGDMESEGGPQSPQGIDEREETGKKGAVPVGPPPTSSGSYLWPVRERLLRILPKVGKRRMMA